MSENWTPFTAHVVGYVFAPATSSMSKLTLVHSGLASYPCQVGEASRPSAVSVS